MENQSLSNLNLNSREINLADNKISKSVELTRLQDLPFEAKTPIAKFVQGKMTEFRQQGEDVPIKVWLLAEALRDVYIESIKVKDGPFGTISHAAAAIGNTWLIEMQIRHGADLTAVDDHGWTALMVAKAQVHRDCVALLSDHMQKYGRRPISYESRPSCLVQCESSLKVHFEDKGLIVKLESSSPTVNLQRRHDITQLRSNHPIPTYFQQFYFEMTVLTAMENA